MDIQAEVEGRKARWRSFMDARGPAFLFIVRLEGDPVGQISRFWPGREDELVESSWAIYQRQLERASWLHDDNLPRLSCVTGTEIFAEAMGCEVHRPDHTMPFALPKVETPAEADKLTVPRLEDSTLMRFFGIADELRRRAGPDALLSLVDVQSPMDIAALVWSKTDMMMAMFDAPDAVKSLAAKIRGLMTDFFDEWFRRYGREYVAHCPDYLMTGGLTLSEDEVGAVSAEMFEEFFLDELAFLSNRYGGLGMHCCADSRHQWAMFKKIPGLRLLNLCAPPKSDRVGYTKDAVEFFKAHCAQMHGPTPATGPVETWPSQLPAGARFVFDVPAKTKEEAIELCAKLNGLRKAV